MAKTDVSIHLSFQYIVFVAVVLVLVLAFVSFVAWSKTPQQTSLISVAASGSVSADPAQASIYLFLNATGNTSASAVANLSAITGRLNSTLLPFLNGNSSLIQTQSYSVYQQSVCNNYTYPIPYVPVYPTTTIYCPSLRTFYTATEYLLVTIPNVAETDAALAGLSAINGVSINDVAAKLSQQQQTTLAQQALSLALSNATGQAQALSGGRQLEVQNITVQNNYIYYPTAGVFSAAAAVATNQTFYPGRATVTKNIYVVFSMR